MLVAVLVRGGAGPLAGWCVMEPLARGFAVWQTGRGVAGESTSRAPLGSVIAPSDPRSFLAFELMRDYR